MKKNILSFLLIIFTIASTCFAYENIDTNDFQKEIDTKNYDYVKTKSIPLKLIYMTQVNQSLDISYEIGELNEGTYMFEIVKENIKESKTICRKQINYKKEILSYKETCTDDDFKYNTLNRYTARIVTASNTLIYEHSNSIQKNTNYNVETIFNDNPEMGTTDIIISVESKVPLKIKADIDKSVIEELNDENKDILIPYSNYPYKIEKADPLISWNIENPPVKINYTINKTLTTKDKNNIKITVHENDSIYKYLKYTTIILILTILFITFKPKKNES